MRHDDYAELGRILAGASLAGRDDDWRRQRISVLIDRIERRHEARVDSLRGTIDRMVTRAAKASRTAAARTPRRRERASPVQQNYDAGD